MTTLREALESLNEDDRLNDGATTWDKWNLLEALQQSDEDQEWLDSEVYVSDRGIFCYKPDGYLESMPVYSFERGI